MKNIRASVVWGFSVAGFLIVLSSPSASAERKLEVLTALASESSAGLGTEARLCLKPLAGAGGDKDCQDVLVPGRIPLHLDNGSAWALSLEASGYWAKQEVLVVGNHSEELTLWLFPAGQVAGRFVVLPAGSLPRDLELSFSPSPYRDHDRERARTAKASQPKNQRRAKLPSPSPSSMICPVDKNGVFQCSVPEGATDLKIHAQGYIPLYFWEVFVRPDKPLTLGRLTLRRGASLAGWIDFADVSTTDGAKETELELSPTIMETPSELLVDQARERFKLRTLSTVPNQRGFFQLVDVPPGSHTLKVRKPGFAVATVSNLEVLADSETLLSEAIRLHPPLKLDVIVDPPFSPQDDPWTVTLLRQAGRRDLDDFLRKQTDLNGWATFEDLDKGTFRLLVEAPLPVPDQGAPATWAVKEIEVTGEQPPLEIRIPWVQIVGTVRAGGEPVQTTMWFLGPEDGTRTSLLSDEDGRFTGHLPREGMWDVEVSPSPGDPNLQKLEPIEVVKAAGDEAAEIEIEIPTTRLSGKVETEEGRGISRAVVILVSPEKRSREAQALSGPDGSFEIRGVRAGSAWLWAQAGELESEWLPIEIEKDRDATGLRLVVSEKLELQGIVTSPAGVVPGALVMIVPESSSRGAPASASRVLSGPDGRFSAKLPATTMAATLVVFPPGHSLHISRLDLQGMGDSIQSVPVAEAGGTLVIELADAEESIALLHGGSIVSLRTLFEWSRTQGGGWNETSRRWVVPRIEGGDYLICRASVLDQTLSASPTHPGCAGGHLFPNSELVLDLTARSNLETSDLH